MNLKYLRTNENRIFGLGFIIKKLNYERRKNENWYFKGN